MSNTNFSFPPPPPPPPVARHQDFEAQQGYSQYSRGGRGNGGALKRGRGRGRGSRGSGWGGHRGLVQESRQTGSGSNNYPCGQNYTQSYGRPMEAFLSAPNSDQGLSGYDQRQHVNTSQAFPGGFNNGSMSESRTGTSHIKSTMKRNYAEAFTPDRRTSSKLATAPAVPSFGSPIPLANAPSIAPTKSVTEKKKQYNQLGLTPRSGEHASSGEEDENEEANLAVGLNNSPSGQILEFSYKGRSSSLKTLAEIEAWIKERKRKYPTKAKIEEAAALKARTKGNVAGGKARNHLRSSKPPRKADIKPKELKSKSMDSRTTEGVVRSLQKRQARTKDLTGDVQQEQIPDKAAKARSKAAKLKRKLEKAQRELEAIEGQAEPLDAQQPLEISNGPPAALVDDRAHTDLSDLGLPAGKAIKAPNQGSDEDEASSSGDSSDTSSDITGDGLLTSDDETSSGGTSGGESDGAPVEISSKQEVPVQESLQRPKAKPRVLCRDFKTRGRCPRGRKCKFLHDSPDQQVNGQNPPNQRVTLYQRLLARQNEEEDKKLLQFIVHLGDNGYLREPEARKEQNDANSAALETI